MGVFHDGREASVPASTIFQPAKVALRPGFLAIFFMAVDQGGKSALALSREFRLPYATSWSGRIKFTARWPIAMPSIRERT